MKVFVITNDMVNDKDREEQWQMRVTVRPVGECTPTQGDRDYSSPWLEAGTEVGVELSVGECVFRIDATMRLASDRIDCGYRAQLSWVPDGGTTPADGHVFTSDRPDGASRLSAVRDPDSACAFPPDTRFYISGSEVVEDLPGPSADTDLLALARRAAEIAAFQIRVEPDDGNGAVPAGCNRTGNFTVRGDGQRVGHPLDAGSGPCLFRASVIRAEPPFEAFEDRAVKFTDDARIVDLTSLVRLPHARIAIIQDVRGSANQGTAWYMIARSCGGQGVTSPAATEESVDLHEGRFTVHSPTTPAFGATTIYPAVAAGPTADTIVGCSVTVSVWGLPDECVVNGGSTQTLTWAAAAPIRHFDVEFDIDCGAAAVGPTTGDTVPATTTPPDDATPPTTAGPAEPAEPATDVDSPTPEPAGGPSIDMPTG